jgi:hypothetical protein
MSGWALWYRRLEHSSIRNILESIQRTSGMEELLGKKFKNHLKFPACIIGKATFEDFPKEKVKADKPLLQVNMASHC